MRRVRLAGGRKKEREGGREEREGEREGRRVNL